MALRTDSVSSKPASNEVVGEVRIDEKGNKYWYSFRDAKGNLKTAKKEEVVKEEVKVFRRKSKR